MSDDLDARARPMTHERLAEIRAREKKATPGPWMKCCHGQASLPDWWSVNRAYDTAQTTVALPSQIARVMSTSNGAEDAAFIAHARTDIADLLEEELER